jgi:hypothetical protein
MSKTIKQGKASISLDKDMRTFYTGFLDTVAPGARKIIDTTLDRIEEQAKKEWPKRQPIVRTNQEGRVTYYEETSKNSWRKFRRGYRVESGMIVGFLVNDAPYSWAIKFGVESVNNQGQHITRPLGARVSNELMVKPMKRNARKVIDALADDLARNAGGTK